MSTAEVLRFLDEFQIPVALFLAMIGFLTSGSAHKEASQFGFILFGLAMLFLLVQFVQWAWTV